MKNEGLSDIEMAFVIYTSRLLKLLIYYLKLAYPLIKLKPRLMFDIHRGKTANNFYYILLAPFTPYWVTTMFDRYTSSIYNGTLIWCELAGV